MGRGGAIYLSYTALVLLSRVTLATAGLWDVDIDESPAPSPEDGPPFSAHASRNMALLPYQVVGIVCSYVGAVFLMGTLMLTVGRTLRLRAQEMSDRPVEMVKPTPKNYNSPLSGSTHHMSYQSQIRGKKSMASSVMTASSEVTYDPAEHARVREADRIKNEERLGNLMGGVYDYQEGQSHGTFADSFQLPRTNPAVKAIYPPHAEPYASRGIEQQDGAYHTRAPSYGSHESACNKSPRQKGFKKRLAGLKIGGSPIVGPYSPTISSPIQRYPVEAGRQDPDLAPLSPGAYTDPGTPPEPPTARTLESQYSPTTPGTAISDAFVTHGNLERDSGTRATYMEHSQMPRPYPQRSGYNYDNEAQHLTDAASLRQDPTSPAYSSTSRQHSRPTTAVNTSRGLALRNYPSTTSPRTPTVPSSPAIVQTTVEWQKPKPSRAPDTSRAEDTGHALESPAWLTVETPRTSRAERKQRERDERALHGAITEEDQVPDDDDLWASGY